MGAAARGTGMPRRLWLSRLPVVRSVSVSDAMARWGLYVFSERRFQDFDGAGAGLSPGSRVFSVLSTCVTRPSWTMICTEPKRMASTFCLTISSHDSTGSSEESAVFMVWLVVGKVWHQRTPARRAHPEFSDVVLFIHVRYTSREIYTNQVVFKSFCRNTQMPDALHAMEHPFLKPDLMALNDCGERYPMAYFPHDSASHHQ